MAAPDFIGFYRNQSRDRGASGRWEGNGVQNLPHNPLPPRQGFAGPMSPSNGFIPRPASALITPGLHQAPEEKEMAGPTTAPNFQSKIVFPPRRKSLSEGGLKQKSFTERLSHSSQTHYSRCSRCNTGSQHSTAGAHPCSVPAAGLSLQPWALSRAVSYPRAGDFKVAGLQCLVFVLQRDVHLPTPHPFLSVRLHFLCACHPSSETQSAPPPPAEPQKGGSCLLPAF